MYIAIIADNIASRKHMERLLDRANDEIMATTGNLYVEAYGDPETMWPSIKRYDLFFVDITQDCLLKELVLSRLVELGLNSQTVICLTEDEDFSSWQAQHGFLSIRQPLSVASLSKIISETYTIQKQNQSQKKIVEFRSGNTTHYVDMEQILYAMEKGHIVEIFLCDGSVKEMLGTLNEFYYCVQNYAEFCMYKKSIVVNQKYVKKIKGRTITLLNDETIQLPLFHKSFF